MYINAIDSEREFLKTAPVAQLDRASGYGPEGCRFDSYRVHHFMLFLRDMTAGSPLSRSWPCRYNGNPQNWSFSLYPEASACCFFVLAKRFQQIQTRHIKAIGIDEIHVGKGMENKQFLTIVRNLQSGALNKLKRRKLKIVMIDMTNACYSWISQEFPNIKIVFWSFPHHQVNKW